MRGSSLLVGPGIRVWRAQRPRIQPNTTGKKDIERQLDRQTDRQRERKRNKRKVNEINES